MICLHCFLQPKRSHYKIKHEMEIVWNTHFLCKYNFSSHYYHDNLDKNDIMTIITDRRNGRPSI